MSCFNTLFHHFEHFTSKSWDQFRFMFCKSKIIWHLKVYFGWARIYLDVTDGIDILNHLMCNGLFDFNIFKNMYHVNINLLHLVTVTWSGYFLDPFQVFGDSGKNAWWIEIGTPCAPANQPNNVGCSVTFSHVSPSVERTTTVAWKWPSLLTCSRHRNLQNIRILQIFFLTKFLFWFF